MNHTVQAVWVVCMTACATTPRATTVPAPAEATAESSPSATHETSRSDPPRLSELRSMLRPFAGHRFDAGARHRGCPDDRKLGEYVEMLVRNGEDGDGAPIHHLKGTCVDFEVAPAPLPIDPPANEGYWYCRIDAFNSDAQHESPWHYELRLRVRKTDRAPDLAHLSCPGTP